MSDTYHPHIGPLEPLSSDERKRRSAEAWQAVRITEPRLAALEAVAVAAEAVYVKMAVSRPHDFEAEYTAGISRLVPFYSNLYAQAEMRALDQALRRLKELADAK